MINAGIELDHPEEMEAFAVFLNSAAAAQRARAAKYGSPAALIAAQDENLTSAEIAAAEQVVEPTKKTRAKKTTTVADLPADVVAEAKAAGINVEDESRIPGNVADPVQDEKDEETAPEVENAPERVEKDADEKPLTEEQVRNTIIDFLNEVQAANPDKPDARSVTLKGLLDKLGAQKISLIPQAEYAKVPGLIAEARKAAGL